MTSIVVTATPGTGALFTVAAGLTRGAHSGLVAAVGCTLGIVPHMVLALSGAAAVMAANPVAFGIVKWLGVAYLLYMGWGIWRQSGVFALPSNEENEDTKPTVLRTIGSAVLVNLLNPKLTVFFFVFLPMFIDPNEPGAFAGMAGLGAVFMAITVAIFAVYGLCAAWVRQYVIGKPVVMHWISRAFAVSFVVLAGMLALTSQ
ncbi:LysE family translocator [Nesterenkonia ebinurensis]|uniref:LysE family translocator n=1 Tax=Nesterenkonia ebinurensis TaxID=2608252 RepID=UPI001CC67C24|nr:LysE family translocator [Nesterenkonia ebinurensis]